MGTSGETAIQPFDFWRQGIATIPVHYRSKRPSVRWQQYQNHLPTEGEMLRWFRPGRLTNAAVVCGWQGLTVLDYDTEQAFMDWGAWALAEGGMAEYVANTTYRVRTSRGLHLYLFVTDTPRCGHFQYGDVKALGGYVLIPPSVHPGGAVYAVVDDAAPIVKVDSLDGIVPDPPAPPTVQTPPLTRVYQSSALWPATVIEQIKAATSIVSYFPDARPTSGNGRWWRARCPWHDDREPSLWIDAERGLCGCYAGCTTQPLDVLDVYARLHGIDSKEAVKKLAEGLP
ncbi:MAG: bifunctional DNA primase/polymerase [Chloroflexota bacterium]